MNENRTRSVSDTNLAQARSRPVRGYVYFVQADEAIKIGYSASPEMRLADLQIGSHQVLELIGIMEGTVKTEHAIHEQFDHLRIRGEWFASGLELLEFIDSVASKPGAPLPQSPPPPTVSAESREMIAGLVNLRSAHGADTPMGYACSNLAEQIENMAGYVRPEWASHECQTLPWMMKRQMNRLEHLKALSN
jgi:hypothetical protein